MLPLAPNAQISVMQILLNYYKILTNNIGFGTVSTTDGSGVPLTYSKDNTNGCMIRVGGSASALTQHWVTSNADTTLQHSLNRIPIGYLVFRKSGTVDVYSGTLTWTNTTICLKSTDATQDTHIYIF